MGPPPPAPRSSARPPRHFQPGAAGAGRAPAGIRLESEELPGCLRLPQAHAVGGARGLGYSGVAGVCRTGLLLPLYGAATVPSRLVRDYNITSVALTYPELIISSSVCDVKTQACRQPVGRHR